MKKLVLFVAMIFALSCAPFAMAAEQATTDQPAVAEKAPAKAKKAKKAKKVKKAKKAKKADAMAPAAK